MRQHAGRNLEEVGAGLWIWRLRHPHWTPNSGWGPVVASTYVESRGERLLLDPLAPSTEAHELWKRLDASSPTGIVILKPDHVRSVDLFHEKYGVPVFGPDRFLQDDVPRVRPEPIFPGSELPGGLVALHDGRGRTETPLWLPEQRTIVFADALTAPEGDLRVWGTPWHEERVLPALAKFLELPFEKIIVSHGTPVHSRTDFERALQRPPWTPTPGSSERDRG